MEFSQPKENLMSEETSTFETSNGHLNQNSDRAGRRGKAERPEDSAKEVRADSQPSPKRSSRRKTQTSKSNAIATVSLGTNGPKVTALGMGTWAWGDKLFWDYGNSYGASQVEEAFKAAVGAGVTFFDTAELYGMGESETLLGRFIKECDRPINVATKYTPAPWRFSVESVSEAISASLKRLELKRITLYQVHWSFNFLMSQETLMNALANEVQRGRIECIGVSNYSSEQMLEAQTLLARRNIPLAVNQVQYSLLNRKVETQGILNTAQKFGITILAYSPLSQGLLTGKYTADRAQIPNGARRIDPRFSFQGLYRISPVLALIGQIAEKYNKTPAQVALNWLIAQENVIPIPGAKNASQAIENAGALGWKLAPEDISTLEQATRPWL
jgi:aryl-alcohol dehydrogenase-like predicted oxidoreductase